MRTVYLFRHGQTLWNAQRRYIGSTDQSLSPEGRAALAGRARSDEVRRGIYY